MKKLITIVFLFLLENTYATIYYVSNAGNDANNGDAAGTFLENFKQSKFRIISRWRQHFI